MPDDPHPGTATPAVAGDADAARDSGAKRAEETLGRVRERMGGSGRPTPGGIRPSAPAADVGGSSLPSGAVGTSSTLMYRPAVEAGGARARPTDQTSEADSRHPPSPDPAARPASARRALAIWMSTVIIATLCCWTAVTVLSHRKHKASDVHR